MKKLISCIMVVATLLTFSFSAMAADVSFVPSITNKGAPELAGTTDTNGKKIIGYIRDSEGKVLATIYEDCLVITSVSDANTSTKIPDDAKKLLLKAYEELTKSGTKLSEVCPELNKIVSEKLGDSMNADNLVIRDFFDITELCDDLKNYLPIEGNTLELTFDLSLPSNAVLAAMVYVDGKWQPVKNSVNNGDGTVTVSFDKICPVAFLVPAGTDDSTVVVTGDTTQSNPVLWGCVMVFSLAAIVVLVYVSHKRKTDKA